MLFSRAIARDGIQRSFFDFFRSLRFSLAVFACLSQQTSPNAFWSLNYSKRPKQPNDCRPPQIGVSCGLALVKTLGVLPRPAALALGQAIAAMFFHYSHKLRKVGEWNLKLVWPELDSAERRRIVRGVFSNFGTSAR